MDAATRAELADLRQRTYGLHPDLADDPAALARLDALEQLAVAEHAGSPPARADGPASAPSPKSESPPRSPRPRAPRTARRRAGGWWPLALTLALVATAVVVARPGSPPPTASPEEPIGTTSDAAAGAAQQPAPEVMLEVPLDDWFGVSNPAPDEIPVFPTAATVTWAAPLGEYYGWSLWVAGASDGVQAERCVLLQHGGISRSRCIPDAFRAFMALVVSLPYRSVEADERPDGFAPGDRIEFLWTGDDTVRVLQSEAATQP
ncbi:hypothetical protein [Microbacterium sp. SS28]|uniref:hypothetical protein n=1 Tax=Microbacterium sp. SS28 TaxID=2919948 RepID=UPI001FAA9CA0|nr:hypothetical protein [Microbacterium sp. SS28]